MTEIVLNGPFKCCCQHHPVKIEGSIETGFRADGCDKDAFITPGEIPICDDCREGCP